MKLRPYQIAVVNNIYEAWNQGAINVGLQLATGGGKTAVFSHIAAEYPAPVIVIAHRTELVSQASLTLANWGIRHNIIAPTTTIREIVTLHVQTYQRSFYDAHADRYVAGIDTLLSRVDKLRFCNQIGLQIHDECFIAGTLVDGRPIETLQIGDMVTAFDENTNTFSKRPITHVFKNKAPATLIKIIFDKTHVLYCTACHPFYTRKGWVRAGALTNNDEILYSMLQRNKNDKRSPTLSFSKNWEYFLLQKMRYGISRISTHSGMVSPKKNTRIKTMLYLWSSIYSASTSIFKKSFLLQQDMLYGTLQKNIFDYHDTDKSEICFDTHDFEKPDASRKIPKKNGGDSENNKAQTFCARGKWKRKTITGNNTFTAFRWTRIYRTISDINKIIGQIYSTLLQARSSASYIKNSIRSGWRFSLRKTKITRFQERRISKWIGLDSVEIQKSTDIRKPYNSSYDGYVYNIEVAGLNTYTANGIVVHNCHHVTADNKWGRAAALFPNARGLFPTATPCRADGKGLGRHADGIIDVLVRGITMRELINAGYLSEYRIVAPPNNLDLTTVNITASGDYSREPLSTAVSEARITGDVVTHYKRLAEGELGITFAVNVAASLEIANAYRQAGIPAETISSKTPALLRAKTMRDFRERRILQLVNVDILGEGVDVPTVKCVSMVRPTASYNVYAQSFGRALRPKPDSSNAIIIDHVNNCMRHGLPDDIRRIWTLDRRARRSSGITNELPLKTCLNLTCFAVYPRALRACPFCGTIPIPRARSTIEQVDGDLLELDPAVLAAMRGEILRVDAPVRIPRNVPAHVAVAITNKHLARQEAQVLLRDAISQWAGYYRRGNRQDAEIHRTFYLTFGTDIMTAQTLGVNESATLRERIDTDILIIREHL